MKKTIQHFLLFLVTFWLLASMLIGCGGRENGKTSIPIIESIKKCSNKYLSIYSIDNAPEGFNLLWFVDSSGKFIVGDTIKFVK